MKENKDKRSMIVEAASTLFQRFGYSKTSLEDIAKTAGLGKGTIYYYFESKEDIFLEVLWTNSNEYFDQLRRLIKTEISFEEKISTAIRMPIKLLYKHAPILLEAMNTLPGPYMQRVQEFRTKTRITMLQIFQEILQEGAEQGILAENLPMEKLVNILFDWFLIGDTNIVIKELETFLTKAEVDYETIIQLILYGLLKRG